MPAGDLPPPYSRLWSVRTLFLLILAGVNLFLALILLWTGTNIINSLIQQYSTELMTEKLHALLHPVNLRYATLQRIGLDDSQPHLEEIKTAALQEFGSFRYKESGSIFVIGKDQKIILSQDFLTRADNGYPAFFKDLAEEQGTLNYAADGRDRFAVYQYYAPWDSYVGLAVDRSELFALKNLFVNIALMLLVAVLLSTILFSGLIQRLIISPLIRLTTYANQISKGSFDCELEGKYPLELGDLKIDIQQMVANLRQKMEQATSQLQIIREREAWLDEAMSALRESEKKYRTIYNAPSDAILIYDPEHRRIVDTNKAMLLMFGYQHDAIRDLGFADLAAGDFPFTSEEAEKKIGAAMDQGPQLFEWLARKSDGELFWAEISLQAAFLEGKQRIIAVLRNIHARKMAEQELASEKERLAVTLRSIGDGVITTDVRGRVVLMNRVAETLTGWRQAEAAGRLFSSVFHIVHQQTGDPCVDPVDKVLQSGELVELAADTALISRDGSQRLIADSGAPIRDPQSRVIGAVFVFRDVTEEKKMEEELFKAQKLESVGVLAGGIAHDFNNILGAILGNVSLARQRLDNPEQAGKLLQNTEKAALRAKDLTAQLLTFSRGGEPIITTASISETIRESAEFVLRGSNVKAHFDIPPDLWLVKVDPGQISQVIQNIVLNARQAIPNQGEVRISCSNCAGCDTGPDSLQERCVRLVIKDNGPGIPAEILPKIFDPYFSTKSDGSGLGLAICHSIVKKHGGHISVESVPGTGTTFTIQLPVSPEQKIDRTATLPLHQPLSHSARVLVMDDDGMILELSQQMLEFLGHKVVTCENGDQALELYQDALTEGNPFDLVIMDLTIPGGMGGERAIKELLRIDPKARAIVASGYSNDRVMAEHREHGFKAMVMKPYQLEDLDQVIRKTLRS
ncbi:MAG: PAS domain S-box protein [Desulfobulbus sp.]|nr:MAG: PAS domain S-box protein [Desulfobulbus sp.]